MTRPVARLAVTDSLADCLGLCCGAAVLRACVSPPMAAAVEENPFAEEVRGIRAVAGAVTYSLSSPAECLLGRGGEQHREGGACACVGVRAHAVSPLPH